MGSLKQIAVMCQFFMTCSTTNFNKKNEYSNKMFLDQLVKGPNDDDIQKEVLACKEEDFSLNNIGMLVINEEGQGYTG